MEKFSIFIISHNRPQCDTYWKLKEMGYKGSIYIIIDDTDKYIEQYKKIYKDTIIIFNKDNIDIDLMDNLLEPKGIATYSREYCLQLAKTQGLDFFLMLDDDLKDIKYRFGKSKSYKIKDINLMIKLCIEFMKNNIDIMTFGTANDYIGGKSEDYKLGRGTNAYLFKVNDGIHFKGRYSEDRIFPILYSKLGRIIFKVLSIQFVFDVWQPNKKPIKGGCNDIYVDEHNFLMMFYPVIADPSSTKEKYNKEKFMASTKYSNVCPMIISSKYKK